MWGVAAGPSARGDLSLFLNDSRAVEHLTGLISSMRGSGLKLWPISQLTHPELIVKKEKKENEHFLPDKETIQTDYSTSFVADLASCDSLGGVAAALLGGGGGWGSRGGAVG